MRWLDSNYSPNKLVIHTPLHARAELISQFSINHATSCFSKPNSKLNPEALSLPNANFVGKLAAACDKFHLGWELYLWDSDWVAAQRARGDARGRRCAISTREPTFRMSLCAVQALFPWPLICPIPVLCWIFLASLVLLFVAHWQRRSLSFPKWTTSCLLDFGADFRSFMTVFPDWTVDRTAVMVEFLYFSGDLQNLIRTLQRERICRFTATWWYNDDDELYYDNEQISVIWCVKCERDRGEDSYSGILVQGKIAFKGLGLR